MSLLSDHKITKKQNTFEWIYFTSVLQTSSPTSVSYVTRRQIKFSSEYCPELFYYCYHPPKKILWTLIHKDTIIFHFRFTHGYLFIYVLIYLAWLYSGTKLLVCDIQRDLNSLTIVCLSILRTITPREIFLVHIYSTISTTGRMWRKNSFKQITANLISEFSFS